MFVSKGYKGVYDLYFANPVSGKRTKITTGKSTKWEAECFKNDFHIDGYINSRVKRVTTLCELKDEYLPYAKLHLATKTVHIYNSAMIHLIQIVGDKPLALLSRRDVELFKSVRAQQVSRTSVNIELRAIKTILSYAFDFNYISVNPSLEVKQLLVEQKEKLRFRDEDIKVLLQSISSELIRDIVIFALLTGCRLNEVLNIQVGDIDFHEMILIIRNKPDFKTKMGRIRHIPISDHMKVLLKSALSRSGKAIELAEPDNYLFTNPMGSKLNGNYVSKRFKKYLRQAGLPEKYHFHCLRHTFITNLVRNGVNINYVKWLAGHSNIKTTMGYVHIESDDLREAVNMVKIAY